MRVCFLKMGVFVKNGSLFFENRSWFFEHGSLVFENGSLFFKCLFFLKWEFVF